MHRRNGDSRRVRRCKIKIWTRKVEVFVGLVQSCSSKLNATLCSLLLRGMLLRGMLLRGLLWFHKVLRVVSETESQVLQPLDFCRISFLSLLETAVVVLNLVVELWVFLWRNKMLGRLDHRKCECISKRLQNLPAVVGCQKDHVCRPEALIACPSCPIRDNATRDNT